MKSFLFHISHKSDLLNSLSYSKLIKNTLQFQHYNNDISFSPQLHYKATFTREIIAINPYWNRLIQNILPYLVCDVIH